MRSPPRRTIRRWRHNSIEWMVGVIRGRFCRQEEGPSQSGDRVCVIHLTVNTFRESLEFEIPPAEGPHEEGWRRCMDISLASPDDICDAGEGPQVQDRTHVVWPRSVAVLTSGSSTQKETSRK